MDKKQLFLWSLYDFANSFVYVNFVLYFAQWIVIDAGLSDFWYNAIYPITTVILLFTAPSLAALTDKHGGRKRWLNIATIGTIIGYGGVALLANRGIGHVLVIALLFLVGQYFYQFSFVFYNPMLEDIADEEHRSRASGIGQFANSLGQVLGIVATLPFAASRTAPLLPAVGLFVLFALPMMIFFREKKRDPERIGLSKFVIETRSYIKKFVAFCAVSVAMPMLVAFFFFNDALLTVSNNYSIYLDRVFSVPDMTKSLLLTAILGMSGVGGIIAGWLGDRIGLLPTLKWILFAWILALPALALAPNFIAMAIVGSCTGLLIGSAWTVTRAYLTTLLETEHMGYGFSYYTILERFATFVGPLTWGGVLAALGSHPYAYRVAVGSMTIFMIIGIIILMRWKRESVETPAILES